MEVSKSSVQQFYTKRKVIWYHENDGYYYRQSGSRCNKIILKCVHRSCSVKGVINNDEIVKLNKHFHCHDPDFEKRSQIEDVNVNPDQIPIRKNVFPKKIHEIFGDTKFTQPIEEFSTERRGTWYHQHDGFYYRRYQAHAPKIYVECVEQTCNITAVMNEDLSGSIFIVNHRVHNHSADKDKKTVMIVRREILFRCKNEDTPLEEIYNNETIKVDDRIRKRIPFSSFKNAMTKNRLLRNPTSPESMTKFKEMIYAKMEHFALDGREFFSLATKNFAVFISPTTRELLEDSHLTFSVDSLKCVPKKPAVNYVLTVGAIVNDTLYPILYILLMVQSHHAFKDLFCSIKQKLPFWKPKTVICEFEKGLNETIMLIFPEAVVAGSWYHYSQNVLLKSNKLIANQFVCDNGNVRKTIQMLMALPLLPANLIKEGLRTIEEGAVSSKLHEIEGVSSMFAYMRNHWIFRSGISLYLMSKTVLHAVKMHEEFYDDIASLFGCLMNTHPNIWVFVDALKNIENNFASKFTIQRYSQNSAQQSYRSKILNARKRLNNEDITILEFLQEVCQYTIQIPGIEENKVELVDFSESDCLHENENSVDIESIELNCDWDYDDVDSEDTNGNITNVPELENC